MGAQGSGNIRSAVFITFPGNCKAALSFYQHCFGGQLQFVFFEKEMNGCPERPVVSGSLVSDRLVIYGSDLVPDEGRSVGNHIAVFLYCMDRQERGAFIEKLAPQDVGQMGTEADDQPLVEIIDAFEVRWILGYR